MAWTLDGSSPRRDPAVSIEDEVASAFAPVTIPWRLKLVRLLKAVTRR
jgi:hypothetical protein